jgi:transposase
VIKGGVRGEPSSQMTFSTVSPASRVPHGHPIRNIKELADARLAELSPVLDGMYASTGRPSIPPERLLKACLLIALYSVRSERQFCERLDYDLLFRFFLDMTLDETSFDASSFARNKERLLRADVARLFFEGVVQTAKERGLISAEHFTVDGTLIEAWASLKSFKKKGPKDRQEPPSDDPGNPTVNFHGEKRCNATHESTTDPDAKLYKKGDGQPARLCYSAHVLMENRNGLCVDVRLAEASGWAERREALAMIDDGPRRGIHVGTLGADKAYDTSDFVANLRERHVTPHVAQQITNRRGSNIDARTTRHPGYALSQWKRKLVEEIFGWMKTIGGLRKTRYRGRPRNALWTYLSAAAYNLLRIARLAST